MLTLICLSVIKKLLGGLLEDECISQFIEQVKCMNDSI